MGEVKGYLNQYMIEITEFPIAAEKIALLVELIESGKISYSIAATKIFPVLIENPMKLPLQIAEELNVIQDSDETSLASYVLNVIDENPLEIDRYKNGEKQLLGFLMGKLMKISNGKADPKQANPLLRKMLDELI
jgi:aspartyl-tRNA(Asn)/glutamyl-tRNA(Gln) amidotransferase subunit B